MKMNCGKTLALALSSGAAAIFPFLPPPRPSEALVGTWKGLLSTAVKESLAALRQLRALATIFLRPPNFLVRSKETATSLRQCPDVSRKSSMVVETIFQRVVSLE
jgi:hypothetical protein